MTLTDEMKAKIDAKVESIEIDESELEFKKLCIGLRKNVCGWAHNLNNGFKIHLDEKRQMLQYPLGGIAQQQKVYLNNLKKQRRTKKMKKTISALAIALALSPALANDRYGRPIDYHRGYQNGYNIGYNQGNSHAKHRAWTIVGASVLVVIGGIIIYEAGRESSWTVSENGVGYRF